MKFTKSNTRKVFFETELERIDTEKNTRNVNDSGNLPTKKKSVISFLYREYLSLEKIHQLSQLQLPTLYIFFSLGY